MILQGWSILSTDSPLQQELNLSISITEPGEAERIIRAINDGVFLEDVISKYNRERQERAIEELLDIAGTP